MNLINGQKIEGLGEEFWTTNPTYPDQVVEVCRAASAAQSNDAVNGAHDAWNAWRNLPGAARANHLLNWANKIAARKDEMAAAMVAEVGKPIIEAEGEAGRCVAILQYFAGEAVRETGQVIPALVGGSLQFSVQVPRGVAGLITPWNFPFAIPLWKAAPALAAGCTVVLKGSEKSALCSRILAETALEAGLPAGVFNVLQGRVEPGEALLNHPLTKALSFTGSAAVGHYLMEQGAARGLVVQAEMGGKNPAIVLEDADLDQAATLIAGGAMRFAGQKCTATSRVIVHQDVKEEFTKRLKAAIEALPIGDPRERSTAIGPVIGKDSWERQMNLIESLRGRSWTLATPENGFFVGPTLIEDADQNEPICQEEVFGPVLAMISVANLDEAIEAANAVPYGLSAALMTKNIPAALQYIHRIEAGLVRVNGDTTGVDPHAPFGGMKASSSGSREQGPAGTDFYTETKTVQINP